MKSASAWPRETGTVFAPFARLGLRLWALLTQRHVSPIERSRVPSLLKTYKDLAREMQLSVKTVQRLSKRLGVPPTVPGKACARFSNNDAARLLSKWARHWRDRNLRPYGNPSGTLSSPLTGTLKPSRA